jgi:hypothetical protein
METRMKRAFAVSLMVAVVATSLLGPAEAAKKKKPRKPPAPAPVQVDQTFFLRRDGADCNDPAALYLSLVDAEDIDSGSCGDGFYGALGEPLGAQSRTYASRDADGVPVTLDATKDITGMIGVKSQSLEGQPVRTGVGTTTLNVEITGVTNGETKTIGTAEVEYDVTPSPDAAQIYEVEFTVKPDAALDKAVFTSVSITLFNSGNSLRHGFYTTDNPASYFKMGTWK